MRHQKSLRKFRRSPSHRKALFRNLATSLIKEEKVETTVPKAKDLRRVVEKLITLAGEDTLHRRRQAYAYLTSKKVVHKLFADIGPRFKARPGGYTRVIRTRNRFGDAAAMAVIELVQEDYSPKAKKKARKTTAASKKKTSAKSEKAAEAASASQE